ncbi:MAG: AIR synthase family protein [Nitrososphaerota archaeon]
MSQRAYMPRFGKISEDVLNRYVLRFVGKRRSDVLLPPRYGEDAGVVRAGSSKIVVAIDPITGSHELLGWLSVHINANDVAVCGAMPRWFSSCILLPRNATISNIKTITKQIHRAAKSLAVAVVTGHTEVAPYIKAPIVIGHMTGTLLTRKIITSSGARPGDYILMSKTAGIEGTAILANDFEEELKKRGTPKSIINNAKRYYRYISVVREAVWLTKHAAVTSMHDPTEGGIIGGLYELSKASKCGFKVWREMIPISDTTEKICRNLKIDPLRLISSGVLLATVKKIDTRALSRVNARIIGRVVEERLGRWIIDKSGGIKIDEPVTDELWRIINQNS